MKPIDVRPSDYLERIGFTIADWRVVGSGGESAHRVTAAGPLGAIIAEAPTRPMAFALAQAEVRELLRS